MTSNHLSAGSQLCSFLSLGLVSLPGVFEQSNKWLWVQSCLTFTMFVPVKNAHQFLVLLFLSRSLAELSFHFWIIPKTERDHKLRLPFKRYWPKWHQKLLRGYIVHYCDSTNSTKIRITLSLISHCVWIFYGFPECLIASISSTMLPLYLRCQCSSLIFGSLW